MKTNMEKTHKRLFNIGEIIFPSLFLITLGFLIIGYFSSKVDQSILNDTVSIIIIGVPMYLFLMSPQSLFKPLLAIFWLISGVLFMLLSFYFTETGDFQMIRGNASEGSVSILTSIALVYLGQFLNRLLFNRDFMSGAWFSLSTERKRDWFDILFTFIGFGIIVVAFTSAI